MSGLKPDEVGDQGYRGQALLSSFWLARACPRQAFPRKLILTLLLSMRELPQFPAGMASRATHDPLEGDSMPLYLGVESLPPR